LQLPNDQPGNRPSAPGLRLHTCTRTFHNNSIHKQPKELHFMETQLSSASNSEPTFEPWLDSRQAAAILRINHKTLERKAREGMIPGYQRFSRWYFRRSELDGWLTGALQSGSQPCRVN
jgi:hypothetical protein